MVQSMTEYNKNVSKYDKIGYIFTIMAVVIQFFLWIMHVNDTDDYGQYFTYIAFYEFIFAFIGFLFYDAVNHRGFKIRKRIYKKLSGWLILRITVILAGLAIIQVLVLFIPLTVTDPEIAMAIVFAGPSEENFFRGVLISIVISLFGKIKGFKIPLPLPFLKQKKEISIWVFLGIIISSIAFAGIHMNYYENPNLLFGTFLCGLWLGLTYWYWEDLTAVIMAHFLLNLIVMFQTFGFVLF